MWYGNVDCGYLYEAIKLLMWSDESWVNFKWTFTAIQPFLWTRKYRALARTLNIRHFPAFCVRSAFKGILFYLRLEYIQLRRKAGKVTGTPVVVLHSRKTYGYLFIKHISPTFMILPASVKKLLQDTANPEDALTCLNNEWFYCASKTNVDLMMVLGDSRSFSIPSFTLYLKSDSTFMKTDPVQGESLS